MCRQRKTADDRHEPLTSWREYSAVKGALGDTVELEQKVSTLSADVARTGDDARKTPPDGEADLRTNTTAIQGKTDDAVAQALARYKEKRQNCFQRTSISPQPNSPPAQSLQPRHSDSHCDVQHELQWKRCKQPAAAETRRAEFGSSDVGRDGPIRSNLSTLNPRVDMSLKFGRVAFAIGCVCPLQQDERRYDSERLRGARSRSTRRSAHGAYAKYAGQNRSKESRSRSQDSRILDHSATGRKKRSRSDGIIKTDRRIQSHRSAGLHDRKCVCQSVE